MKCPKCGYNSFESHDVCKKCSGDLSGYKLSYGITPIVLPLEVREKMAEEFRAASAETGQHAENIETHEDMFAFDLPEETVSAAAPINDDPFNFDDEPLQAGQGQAKAKAEEDPFADLLESTSQTNNDPFGAPPAAAAPQAAAKAASPTSSPDEFDLENFSWDDTPATTPGGGEKDAADDFDSLFGDTNESTKK
ncbi:MAG: hypothetical protein H7Y05_05975 [Steroidobacteraceae bacterium]|nr:hypothetical protein [Deltaproteobacteria bacterium]